MISFKIDWFDLLAFQGTPKSFLQHQSSKASTLQHSAFFMVQLSQLHMNTGKPTALTIRTSVGKVMSLLFHTLSRIVIAFPPRSKHLLTSWMQSPSTVMSEPNKRESATASTFSPSICHEVLGPDAMILVSSIFSFKPAFPLYSFTLIKKFLVPLYFLPLECHHLHI